MVKKIKVGDVVQMKYTAASEYRGAVGKVTKPADKNGFYGISLVSDNGSRAVWAVHRSEIAETTLNDVKKMIERDDNEIYDAAANMFPSQIVNNVKHTMRFKLAVMDWMNNQ